MAGWVFAAPAAFVRIRAVARMIADSRLAEHSAIIGWGLLASMLALAGLITVAMSTGTNALESRPLTIVMLIVVTALITFLLGGAFVLIRCVLDFRRAARMARSAATQPS